MGTWPRQRSPSVDAMRGLAMATMIVVNNPGDRQHVYRELRHAVWNGFTLADFVFPVFLFLVGVCVALAVNRDAARDGRAGGFWPRVLKRTAILFALGLLENAYLRLELDNLRIPGVLQRIALVYLGVTWLHVRLGRRGIAAVIAAILVGHWLLLTFTPVPGLGRPSLEAGVNLQGWLDQILLGAHIWKRSTTWDPEGVLSTFPAIALGLIGLLAGRWLRAGGQGTARVFATGLAVLFLGLFWDAWFPINKSLCTSSFVLLAGGAGIMLLAGAHRLLDERAEMAMAKPFLILGRNPLAVYLAASFLASTLRHVRVDAGPAGTISLRAALFTALFSGWPDPFLASLAWAILFLLVAFFFAWGLFSRRVVIIA